MIYDDTGFPIAFVTRALAHPDTGFVPVPAGLVSIKQAAASRNLSETAMRRRVKRLGIGIVIGKTILVPMRGLEASRVGDTGRLDDVQHDVEIICALSNWPISASTPRGHQPTPTVWNTVSPTEVAMQINSVEPMRFDGTLRLRLPGEMHSMLQYAARRRVQSLSDFVRQALLTHLQREGLTLLDTGAVRRPEEV
jgi:HicB-like protein involved in pilus formation